MRSVLGVAVVAASIAFGCGPGTGQVDVTIWGEEYIAEQIPPASTENPGGFADGWTVAYGKFLVNVGNFTVATTQGTTMGQIAGFRVYDLRQTAQPAMVGSIPMLTAQRWNRVSFELAPASAQSVAGNATAADLAMMQTSGYSVYMEGTATHPMRGMYTFRWGFNTGVVHENCQNRDEQEGLVVPTGGTFQAQMTIHGDHTFYDDLQSPDARVRFDAIAGADANMDRMITLEELEATRLTTLPTGQYGTGSVPNVNNLRQFVTHLMSTLGHFDGEGHCDERLR